MPTSDRVLREVRRFAVAARADDDSDRALVERFARTRDERAFAELVRRHGPMVLGVCRRVLRHAADADDAFQAAFLILVRRAAVIRDPDRLGAWLFGVAWRTANKLRASRRPNSPLHDDVPERHLASSDWPVELDAAIARLPEKYRTPVVLCHLQGLTTAEAAHRLGCPPATVTTRLFRARNTLRRRLTALGLTVPVALTGGSVLHVPSALAAAAHAMAAGRSIPPAAARLADGVFRSLLMTKIRWAATAAAVCLTGVGLLGFQAGGQEPPAAPTPPPTAPLVAPPPPLALAGEQPATVRSANFQVTAPSQRIARLVADAAERARKEIATAWLGKEQGPRQQVCPIRVTVNPAGSGGATTFTFDGGNVTAQMQVEGPLDRLLADVIPHEVTHLVMADHFRTALPRWADEGIALQTESEEERVRYIQLAAEAANAGHLMQVKALLAAREYPREVAAFFAESYWLARLLVERKDRATFLNFVRKGMTADWESAAKEFYGSGLDEIEKDMLDRLKAERKAAGPAAAARPRATPVMAMATADASGQISVSVAGTAYEPVTSYRPRPADIGGGVGSRTAYEPVTSYWLRPLAVSQRRYARAQVRATDAGGNPVGEGALLDRLKGKSVAVVVTSDAAGLDKAFADLLKPDTLILIVPAMRDDPKPPAVAVPK